MKLYFLVGVIKDELGLHCVHMSHQTIYSSGFQFTEKSFP